MLSKEHLRPQQKDEIEKMELSLAKRDYLELVVSCNWIRGEANTLGFEALNQPVQSIELQLRRRKFSQIITHLSELRNMAERIDIKRVKTGDAPVQYVVPASANNTAIYENFVSQLGTKLLEMELALGDENIRQIGQLCRWVERYSEKIRFLEVMDAAKQLRQAIDADNIDDITGILKNFVALYSKIEIVREQTAS